MSAYEFFYGMDFFNLELLFRGFLVIGLSQVLGKDAIIPMVTTYCFLHFGKPVGEQISSIVGGYILGVIAFYTRGIWGGGHYPYGNRLADGTGGLPAKDLKFKI